jgi:serine/threonine protein phosphatase PrpC
MVASRRIHSYGMTDVGLVRRRNEDVWGELPEQHCYLLSDGMGGHLGGDIAAQETIHTLAEYIRTHLAEEEEEPEAVIKRLRKGIEEANEAVYTLSRSDRSLRGMGATLCCLYLCGQQMVVAHVGDSRIYRLRADELTRLTSDHSLVTELLESGQISEEEAERFIYKHIITRAMGTKTYVEPDIQLDPTEAGDLYMLCSDGLTDRLGDAEIEQLLLAESDLEKVADRLRDRVYEEGAPDNITILFVKIDA